MANGDGAVNVTKDFCDERYKEVGRQQTWLGKLDNRLWAILLIAVANLLGMVITLMVK